MAKHGNRLSAEICPDATLQDLDPIAIATARQLFIRKNPRLAEDVPNWDDATFLNKARVTIQGKSPKRRLYCLVYPNQRTLLTLPWHKLHGF